jgi:hypothetical protein
VHTTVLGNMFSSFSNRVATNYISHTSALNNLNIFYYILLSITNKMQHYTIFFIAVNALYVSGGFSAHHQELKTVHTASGLCQACLLQPLAWVSWNWFVCIVVCVLISTNPTTHTNHFQCTHASSSSKQAWHIPDAVCTVLSSWWWAEKPSGTCTALTAIKNTL